MAKNFASTHSAFGPAIRIAVRPCERFFAAWQATRDDVVAGRVQRIAVIGAGAGGVELALAIHAACTRANAVTNIVLATEDASILATHGKRARAQLHDALRRRAIDVRTATRIVAIEPGSLVTAEGARLDADRVFLATTAIAPAWLAQSGLRCDPRGFVLIDDGLQSVSHPFVFASGDCATMLGRLHPKSGAHAVRQASVLAANLLAFARGASPRRFSPRRVTLALIGTGDRRALLSYGSLAAQGAWLWRLKDRIDRKHIARYRSGVHR